MKELHKKFLNIGLAPYSIPVTMAPAPGPLSAQHLSQYQMQNYLLGASPGLQLQNSSGKAVETCAKVNFPKHRLKLLLKSGLNDKTLSISGIVLLV